MGGGNVSHRIMSSNMFMFTTATWSWVLAAAVGIPVAAHLLSRRGGALVDFPTLRFLKQAK